MIQVNVRMTASSFTLFPTTIGQCAIAWRISSKLSSTTNKKLAITGFQLPEATPKETKKRIANKANAHKALSTPTMIKEIITRIQHHFAGEIQDFLDLELDLNTLGSFAQKVYTTARTIPAGQTMTYGQLAKAAGHAGAARAVGHALAKNPIPLLIPCHRILAANKTMGGFSAHGGLETKKKILNIEGAF